MKAYKITQTIPIICICLTFSINAQNRDDDGINDILEHKLALKFAPEWRFNCRIDGDDSQQNNNEKYFPSSVEWFHYEVKGVTGHYPQVWFYHTEQNPPYISPVDITDMSQLSSISDPKPPYERADSPNWEGKRGLLRIGNYPKYIGGDPQHFPTYYHCSLHYSGGAMGSLVVEYYLWFPDDHPGDYTFLGAEFEAHRGDWENIAVVVTGVSDLSSSDLPNTASISKVVYNGHFTPGKIVHFGDPALHLSEETHPQVFVSWGTHAMYPEPGEWHNAKLSGPNVYDDFFHGNGLVAKSWYTNRDLINLGEVNQPLVGWLLFGGLWGPDGSESNGSPPSPQFRGEWGTIGNADDWGTIKMAYKAWWDKPIEIDGNIEDGFCVESTPRLVLFKHDHWNGDPSILGVTDCSNIGISGEASSAWLLGGARAILYSGPSCSGQYFSLTHSCEDLKRHYSHDFGDKAESAKVFYGATQVYADWCNYAGYQDGSLTISSNSGPYATIGRANFNIQPGGLIIVGSGSYPEIITLDKKVTITSSSGSVIIGKFNQ